MQVHIILFSPLLHILDNTHINRFYFNLVVAQRGSDQGKRNKIRDPVNSELSTWGTQDQLIQKPEFFFFLGKNIFQCSLHSIFFYFITHPSPTQLDTSSMREKIFVRGRTTGRLRTEMALQPINAPSAFYSASPSPEVKHTYTECIYHVPNT